MLHWTKTKESDVSMFDDIAALKTWLNEAESAMKKAIETGDVTGLKKVVNDLRDLGFVHDDRSITYGRYPT